MGIKGGYGIAMTWKRISENEDIFLHRAEMSMGRWKLCKELDQWLFLSVM